MSDWPDGPQRPCELCHEVTNLDSAGPEYLCTGRRGLCHDWAGRAFSGYTPREHAAFEGGSREAVVAEARGNNTVFWTAGVGTDEPAHIARTRRAKFRGGR